MADSAGIGDCRARLAQPIVEVADGAYMRGFLSLLLTGVLTAGWAVAANAQQIDDPRLDPIFGRRYEDPDRLPDAAAADDEFGGEQRWTRLSGFVGMMTFLAPDTTNLSVGVGPVYKPDYFGSDDYEWDVDPAAYVRFRNLVFFDDDGADVALFGFSNFSIGPSIRIVGEREEDDNPALAGLGDVGMTFELGGFIATTFLDRYLVRMKARHGIATGHRGTIVDARGTALLFRWGPVSTSISAETSWIDNRYADAYFSVSPTQSANSGLPVYDAGAGFRDVGGSLNAYINVGKQWSLNPYVSYSYIFDSFNDTPIIAQFGDRNQFRAGFHLLREFSFGRERRSPLRDDN